MNKHILATLCGLVVVMTTAVLPLCGERSMSSGRATMDARWKHEGGNLKTVDAARRGFRTRAMSGIEGEAGRAWAERNGLTPLLAFSHNLSAIFPPALHAQHPEFFPLVNGERMRPRDGANNWNPDLGREDVAAWAADAARRHFDAHPESESFSVGVNDGLIFGDSEETLAFIRPRAGEMVVQAQKKGSEPIDLHRRNAEDVQSRPDLFEQEAIRGRPEFDLSIRGRPLPFSVCPRVVSCENQTLSWFRQRPDISNLVFGFTNRVARDVARTHPGRYVGALAYYWCENAPDFPLEPNVIPFLTADRSQGYDENFRREELALQQRWAAVKQKPETRDLIPEIGGPRAEQQVDHETHESHEKGTEESERMAAESALRSIQSPGGEGSRGKKRETSGLSTLSSQQSTSDKGGIAHGIHGMKTEGGAAQVSGFRSQVSAGAERRLGLYDYLYGSGFLVPRIHTRLIADNLRQARRLGFTDYFAEVNPNWGLDGPMPWLVAQLLQDPEQSRAVLLEEYYQGCFGDAAVPMRRFFERCEQQWMHQPGRGYWLKHYRNESQARLFPSAVCRELRALLAEAARQARGASVQARVKFVSDAFGVTERFVAFCEARDALNRAVLTRETHEARSISNQGRVDHETHEIHEKGKEGNEPMAAGSALRSIQSPGEKGNPAKREEREAELSAKTRSGEGPTKGTSRSRFGDVKRDGASQRSTLSSQPSPPARGRSAHETHELHEKQAAETELVASGSALRSIPTPGGNGDQTKRGDTNGGGAPDLSTLSSQLSTADGRKAHETHELHKKEEGTGAGLSAKARSGEGRSEGLSRSPADERGMADLSTLSSQLSTADGLRARESHELHERDTEAGVAQVSGFSSQVSAGEHYHAAREEFISYTKALMAREPQALAPFRWEDYLRHEPSSGDGGRETVDGGWAENLLSNGDLHGPLQTPKRIAGLDYGVAMPAGWITTVEPAEGQSARVEDGILRLERNKETFVYQWLPARAGARYRATVEVRGRVLPSATASLTLSWLDERQAPLGFKVHRLPEGSWPEWVTLEVAQDLPAAARWIGTGVRVQHQLEGDWIEVRAVRLERVR